MEHTSVRARGPARCAVGRRRNGLRVSGGRLSEERAAEHDPPASHPRRRLEQLHGGDKIRAQRRRDRLKRSIAADFAGEVNDNLRAYRHRDVADSSRLGEVANEPPHLALIRALEAAQSDDVDIRREHAEHLAADEPACASDQDARARKWCHGALPHRARAIPGPVVRSHPVSNDTPALSIGLAVRNARHVVERCIESILSQDFTDLELVIYDNTSDDGTIEKLEAYARADTRIVLSVNEVNIGLQENMRRVLASSRGTLFRWVSADDWLEPGYLSACVRALEGRPDAIGVTTWFTIHTPDGSTRYEEYRGEFPTSPDPARRFERMLWFFHAGDAKYDPIYGIYRRERLLRSHGLRPSERNDWLLCAELALIGPILHVDKRLANRTREYPVGVDRAAFRRRLDPVRGEQIRTSPRRLYRELFALAVSADLTDEQLRCCKRALRRFWVKEVAGAGRLRVSDVRHGVLRR